MLAGRLAARFGAEVVLIGGSLIGTSSFALLAFAHDHDLGDLHRHARCMGAGFGLAFSAMSSLDRRRGARPSRPAWPAA